MTEFEDKMAQLQERFVARCPGWLEDLQVALDARQAETVGVLAHRLAGNAGMFGYPQLSEAGAELESAAIEGDIDRIALCGQRVSDLLEGIMCGEGRCES